MGRNEKELQETIDSCLKHSSEQNVTLKKFDQIFFSKILLRDNILADSQSDRRFDGCTCEAKNRE